MDVKSFSQSCEKNGYNQEEFSVALTIVKKYLKDKERAAGDSYFNHNLRVAQILIENNSEPQVIKASLLHGLLKIIKPEEIRDKFGEEIVKLLAGLEELNLIKLKNKQSDAEVLRKIILTTLNDSRVILLKLAFKLDNLQSIQHLSEKEQKRIAQDVIDIYGPLAYRLGIEKIRVKLEDLAFSVLNPRKFKEINNFLEESRDQREKNIEEAISVIKDIIGVKVKIENIKGRPKQIYSIYKKFKDRSIKLDQQHDLLGIRVIVPEIKDCYTLLGLLHENFEPLDDRLKDYIANPKPNFYRSLHTGIKLPSGRIAEIQIRTAEMHQFAEEGLAAHWRYKKFKSDEYFEKKISWLKSVMDMQRDNREQLERLKIDLFGDKIYCYTPKGDVKELPQGASILDFAFLVHEEIGSKCVGARVNGKFVPIKHKLNSGDVIEILTNKNQRPRRSWIKLVTSSRARQKIRKSLKVHENLPALYYKAWTPLLKDEQGILVQSEVFPKAVCVLAKCCNSLPGEEIIGILTKRKMISVHKSDCRVAEKEQNRWIPVQWKGAFNQKIKFFVNAEERSGLLADLLHTIANAGFEVKEAKAKLLDRRNAECSFKVIPKDLDHLQELVVRVNKVKGIRKIYFE